MTGTDAAPAPRAITARLAFVARSAGVSAMTVSRVLRNVPHVSRETRERVLRAVRKADYHPDPRLARLMSLVRSAKRRVESSVIAVVREGLPARDRRPPYQYVALADFRRRAEPHGYGIEEFAIGKGGLSAARVNSILQARGIEAVIVAPHSPGAAVSQLDFSNLAAVTLGYGLQFPALHRASTNMTQGILLAAAMLEQRGYCRIGLAITDWVDARADHTYSGALLHYQAKIEPRRRVPLLRVPDDPAAGADAFCRWVRTRRPDAIISLDAYVPDWLTTRLGLRIPEDIGLVIHDWTEGMEHFAGIYHRRPWVAGAAVDLLVTQLLRNERGLPEVPQQVLIPPAWVDGPSLPAMNLAVPGPGSGPSGSG